MAFKVLHTHCCYCRRRFDTQVTELSRTKDHFIPRSRTGNNSLNILQCCHECNQWKADKMPEEWLKEVERLERQRSRKGTYNIVDYRQIIGSVRHFMKHFKGKIISDYKIK